MRFIHTRISLRKMRGGRPSKAKACVSLVVGGARAPGLSFLQASELLPHLTCAALTSRPPPTPGMITVALSATSDKPSLSASRGPRSSRSHVLGFHLGLPSSVNYINNALEATALWIVYQRLLVLHRQPQVLVRLNDR